MEIHTLLGGCSSALPCRHPFNTEPSLSEQNRHQILAIGKKNGEARNKWNSLSQFGGFSA